MPRPYAQGEGFVQRFVGDFAFSSVHDFVLAPILKIEICNSSSISNAADGEASCSGIVVSSLHAMGAALDYLERYPETPLFCVGQRCLDLARETHVRFVVNAPTVEELAKKIVQFDFGAQADYQSLIYFCGRDVRASLGRLLGKRFSVQDAIVYQADFTESYFDEIRAFLRDDKPDKKAILFFSARTAELFFRAFRGDHADQFEDVVFLCISAHVARAVPPSFNVRIAPKPSYDGMASLVRDVYSSL